ELDILLLPADPDPLPFLPAKSRIALARDLGQHPVAADREMQLHEIAEELDEQDLAVGRIRAVRCGAALVDLYGRGPDRDERLVADRSRVAGCDDVRLDVVRAGHAQPVTVALRHAAANDVVIAHE